MAKEKKSIIEEGNYDPYEELANAIIIQACEDYKRAYNCYLRRNGKAKKTEKQLAELEEFFLSDWYKKLTEVDGEELMKRLREEVSKQNEASCKKTGKGAPNG